MKEDLEILKKIVDQLAIGNSLLTAKLVVLESAFLSLSKEYLPKQQWKHILKKYHTDVHAIHHASLEEMKEILFDPKIVLREQFSIFQYLNESLSKIDAED